MAIEIERKFLIKDDFWRNESDEGTPIKQGYLNSTTERTVRVRIYGNKGFITIKGKNENLTRKEFEYEIPLNDAVELLKLCERPIIEKTRFLLYQDNNTWEIDVFDGENEGLIIAEIELTSESDTFKIPSWLGEEVSHDTRYYNSSLIINPYINWRE